MTGHRSSEPSNTFSGSGAGYSSPGWKRAQERTAGVAERGSTWRSGGSSARTAPIEGEGRLVAVSAPTASAFTRGERVFHVKFGYGLIKSIEGNKLTITFEKAGEKKVIDSFVDKT